MRRRRPSRSHTHASHMSQRSAPISHVIYFSSSFKAHADLEAIDRIIEAKSEPEMTPSRFRYLLFKAAAASPQRIIMPEGEDVRVLAAAAELQRRNLCEVVVLGQPKQVAELAAQEGIDLDGVEIIHPPPQPTLIS